MFMYLGQKKDLLITMIMMLSECVYYFHLYYVFVLMVLDRIVESPKKRLASSSKLRFGTADEVEPLKQLIKPEVIVPV